MDISGAALAIGGSPELAVQLGATAMAITYLATIDYLFHSGLARITLVSKIQFRHESEVCT